jgi:hypothetical protein
MSKNTQIKEDRKKKKRKGVHAKSKASYLKGSKHWKKPYKGQGR